MSWCSPGEHYINNTDMELEQTENLMSLSVTASEAERLEGEVWHSEPEGTQQTWRRAAGVLEDSEADRNLKGKVKTAVYLQSLCVGQKSKY